MATEIVMHPTDWANRAHELSTRAAAIAWMMAVADENELPDNAHRAVGEQLAEMVEELGKCADELFEAWRAAKGMTTLDALQEAARPHLEPSE